MEVSVSVVARSSRSHILLNNDLALMVPFKPVSPPKLSLYDKANGKVVESGCKNCLKRRLQSKEFRIVLIRRDRGIRGVYQRSRTDL